MHSSRMRTVRSSNRLLWGCLSRCMLGYTPLGSGPGAPLGVGLETFLARPLNLPPPGVGLETPPSARPLNLHPGCEPGDPPGQTPQPPLWVWAWRLPFPHCEQNSYTLLKILPCPNFVAGGNKTNVLWNKYRSFIIWNWFISFRLHGDTKDRIFRIKSIFQVDMIQKLLMMQDYTQL